MLFRSVESDFRARKQTEPIVVRFLLQRACLRKISDSVRCLRDFGFAVEKRRGEKVKIKVFGNAEVPESFFSRRANHFRKRRFSVEGKVRVIVNVCEYHARIIAYFFVDCNKSQDSARRNIVTPTRSGNLFDFGKVGCGVKNIIFAEI